MSLKGIFPIDNWNFGSQSILEGLPADELALLTSHKSEQVYSKGEIIFREGSFPMGIFYIREGKVKKYKLDKVGGEQIIYVANTGELIGYHSILSGDRYPDSAAALEESSVVFIPREDFLTTLENSLTLGKRLLKTLSHEFTVLTNSITLMAQRPVRERLALQLLVLREKYKEPNKPGFPVEINMSRDDLASLAGTARENVVRILTQFKEEGILETRGRKIVIINMEKLLLIANHK